MDDLKTKVVQQSAEVQQSFSADRSVFMGFAILLVVIYHVMCVFHFPHNFVTRIPYRGYIGVDIFFFLSALGLCYSYTKNGLKQFYINRFVRIIPLFFLVETILAVIYQMTDGGLSTWGYICNITSLSYYHLGGNSKSWFIPAIIPLYLLFPMVFKKVRGGGRIVLLCIVSEVVVLLVPMENRYNYFISRIGIFLFGILFYRNQTDKTFILKSIVASLALFVLFFVLAHFLHLKLSQFLAFSFLTPLIMYVFSIIIRLSWLAYVKRALAWLGKHTLELFLADGFVTHISHLIPSHFYVPWTRLLLVFSVAFIFYHFNRQCTIWLTAKKIVLNLHRSLRNS